LIDAFDVRELSTFREPKRPPVLHGRNDTKKNQKAWAKYLADEVPTKARKRAIKKAIESGELKKKEEE
jgi:hypothetical protein